MKIFLGKEMSAHKDPVIKKIRKSLNLTQKEFSMLIGVTQQAISIYEIKASRPSYKVAMKILNLSKNKGFNYTLQDIFSE